MIYRCKHCGKGFVGLRNVREHLIAHDIVRSPKSSIIDYLEVNSSADE